jgi:hypothetical protein
MISTPSNIVYRTGEVLRKNPGQYFVPAFIARRLNISWIEAALALWVCREMGIAYKRRDGRFLWKDRQKLNQGDAWQAWLKSDEGKQWRAFVDGYNAGAQR